MSVYPLVLLKGYFSYYIRRSPQPLPSVSQTKHPFPVFLTKSDINNMYPDQPLGGLSITKWLINCHTWESQDTWNILKDTRIYVSVSLFDVATNRDISK